MGDGVAESLVICPDECGLWRASNSPSDHVVGRDTERVVEVNIPGLN